MGMSATFHTLFRIIHTNLPNFVSWLLLSLGYMCFKLYQLITTHHVINHLKKKKKGKNLQPFPFDPLFGCRLCFLVVWLAFSILF